MEKTGWKGKLVSVIPEGRAGLVLMMLAAALLSACAFEGYRLDEHAREGSYDAASVAGEGRGQHQTAYFRIQINASPRAEKGRSCPFSSETRRKIRRMCRCGSFWMRLAKSFTAPRCSIRVRDRFTERPEESWSRENIRRLQFFTSWTRRDRRSEAWKRR